MPCDFLFEALDLFKSLRSCYKTSGNPRLHVELCLIKSQISGAKKKTDESVNTHQPIEVNIPPKTPNRRLRKKIIPPAPKSISLKTMLNGNEQQKAETPEQDLEPATISNDFTQNNFGIMEQYAENIQARQPRFK